MTLCVHFPARHFTPSRLAALRQVLSQYPGGDPVELESTQGRFRLPLTVDAAARGLVRAVHLGVGHAQCMAHVLGLEPAF